MQDAVFEWAHVRAQNRLVFSSRGMRWLRLHDTEAAYMLEFMLEIKISQAV